MGYYTTYELTFTADKPDPSMFEAIEQWLNDIAYGDVEVDRCSNAAALYIEQTKWYRYESDVKAFANANPEITIIIDGSGEGDGPGIDGVDLWRHVFKGDLDQKVYAKISFPSFDPPFANIK